MGPPGPQTPQAPGRPSTPGHVTSTPHNPIPLKGSQSCLPRPLFLEEPHTLSTKKERRGHLFQPPTRPPAKSCPPKSRVYLRSGECLKSQLVTFSSGGDKAPQGTPLHSAAYSPDNKTSYFEQAFAIEKEIGNGYFGTVYRVRSKDDNQLYAVKIANEKYRGPSDRARKLEEVRKHQFLPPHTNLVRFHNSWEEKGRLYQQFELCATTLAELAEKQDQIPQADIWSYLVDLLQAVQHLHDHDHIHMDIKPENIFIGMDGICKLGDFGLMLDLAAAEMNGMEGDPKYLAPEVLQGRFTKACDVFSLGVTILELACDLDLPRGGDLWHSLRKVGPDPSCTLHLQPELRRVIQLMMTRDEDRRPSVSKVLGLPPVQAAVRRRARQLKVAKLYACVAAVFALLVPVISIPVMFLLQLLKRFSLVLQLPENKTTPKIQKRQGRDVSRACKSTSDAFSDDEPECTVSTMSSPESELAAPLRDSDSSGTGGTLGRTPRRPSDETPPWRHTSRLTARTPHSFRNGTPGKAAVSPGKRLFAGSGPSIEHIDKSEVGQGTKVQREQESAHPDSDSDSDLMLKPQCLASTFDAFSDEDF